MPAPTPPGETSPSIMLTRTVPPPTGVKESCAALTAPVEVPVVNTANIDESQVPNWVSLPSIAPPASWPPASARRPRPTSSAATAAPIRNVIAPRIDRPCLRLPTIVPSVRVRRSG